ncbi:Phage portal protein, partial [human gut metagenome]
RAAGADPRNHRTHPRRDPSSLEIVNRPPTRSKPLYMKVWEARKADGLDYDPEDERQQHFLAEITKYNLRSID